LLQDIDESEAIQSAQETASHSHDFTSITGHDYPFQPAKDSGFFLPSPIPSVTSSSDLESQTSINLAQPHDLFLDPHDMR